MEIPYPYYVITYSHAARKIPIIIDKNEGIRKEDNGLKIGYPNDPYVNGKPSDEFIDFLAELQVWGKIPNRIHLGDSVRLLYEFYKDGVKQIRGINYFNNRAFRNGEEFKIIDDYSDNGKNAAVLIKRTEYGSYLLFYRYKDTNDIQYLREGDLIGMVNASNEMFKRQDKVVNNQRPAFRIKNIKLTIDGFPILKIFESDSDKRWFVTSYEEVTTIEGSDNETNHPAYLKLTQYFGVIQDNNKELWDFWMSDDIEPLLCSGKITELNLKDSFHPLLEPSGTIKQNSDISKDADITQGHRMLDEPGDWKVIRNPQDGVKKDVTKPDNTITDNLPEMNAEARKWLVIGRNLEKKGNYQEAIEAFFKSTMSDSEHSEAYYGLWNSYSKLGNPYESKDAFAEACKIDARNATKMRPDNPDLLRKTIIEDFITKSWYNPIGNCDRYLSWNPADDDIWYIKGCYHYKGNQFKDAILAFHEATKVNPRNYYAINDLGVLLCRMGQNYEGSNAFRNVISIAPMDGFELSLIKSNLEKSEKQEEGKSLEELVFLE